MRTPTSTAAAGRAAAAAHDPSPLRRLRAEDEYMISSDEYLQTQTMFQEALRSKDAAFHVRMG
jgi:hypothetical protein